MYGNTMLALMPLLPTSCVCENFEYNMWLAVVDDSVVKWLQLCEQQRILYIRIFYSHWAKAEGSVCTDRTVCKNTRSSTSNLSSIFKSIGPLVIKNVHIRFPFSFTLNRLANWWREISGKPSWKYGDMNSQNRIPGATSFNIFHRETLSDNFQCKWSCKWSVEKIELSVVC